MPGAKARVLVVDDDEDDFRMLRDILAEIENRKFELTWASSYDAGREAIEKDEHDIAFLDYRLGARTGLELLKESMESGCRIPIILLTGYGEHEVDLEAMRVGAADYLIKDQISPQLLERSIRYSIHRRQELESRRQMQAQILVQDRLASVGLLASSLAHEIGTPLGVIRGRAEYLGLQTGDNPAIRKNVDVIISQIDRVSRLIHSLLNLARGDHSEGTTDVSISRVVSEVLELMAHEFRRNRIEIRNELPPDVAISVRAETSPLHQVLLNLLVNAVHAIQSATLTGRKEGHFLRLAARDAGAFWTLIVQDSGCGISRANMKNIFKPFFTTKEIGVGTGLGLATSYGIVKSWGGTIHVDSEEGVGTTFELDLPRAGASLTSS